MNQTCSTRNCQNPRRNGKQRYCNACHATWMRENRNPMTPEQRERQLCRLKSNYMLRSGKLVRENCKCGSNHAEMHHENYDRPDLVTWVCRNCHLKIHAKEHSLPKLAECG